LKTLRFWLVLLMAVLLPLRGAVGAALLCPMDSSAEPALVMQVHDMCDAHEHAPSPHSHGDRHDHADGDHDHADHADHDKCNLCVALCAVTPMVSDPPALPVPPLLGALPCPACTDSPPSFVPDGEKRPPRSI